MPKRTSKLPRFIGLIDELGSYQMQIGLPRETGKEPKRTGNGAVRSDVTVAQAAFFNEYGTSTIPARPAFRQAARSIEAKRFVRDMLQSFAMLPKNTAREDVLDLLRPFAQELAALTHKSVRRFSNPGNAESTIDQKGFDDPLVDTGQLLESIRAVILKGKRKIASVKPR